MAVGSILLKYLLMLCLFGDIQETSATFAAEDNFAQILHRTRRDVVGACGQDVYTDDVGVIKSPGYPGKYPNNALCIYQINAPEGWTIRLEFKDLRIQSARSCQKDSLRIFDGDSEDSPLIAEMCGRLPSDHFNEKQSRGNRLLLRFVSDDVIRWKGFKIRYTLLQACGEDVFTNDTGVITSPGFPVKYPNSASCVYRIEVPDGMRVRLDFKMMRIQYHELCRLDFLRVFDGGSQESPLMAQLCGKIIPAREIDVITSTGIKLLLHFISNWKIPWKGFWVTYTSVPAVPDCKLTEQGLEYEGTRNVSQSNLPCLPWYEFGITLDSYSSYCRNPDDDVKPWCYVDTADIWEHCDIPLCEGSQQLVSQDLRRNTEGILPIIDKVIDNRGREIKIVRETNTGD